MRYRITFVAGLAVGYVLGTKAGRARYEQITRAARRITENPAVQETAGLVGAQVSNAGKTVYTQVSQRLPVTSVRDFLSRPTEEEAAEAALIEHAELNGRPPGAPPRG
ncbi:hypothetical protein [Nocardiopsis ansamitocini]|uniref:Uncharacterized protein n=1 Tax=Nocardiopsis ansamitocini TaxID=1670832 RepID=A0A9W6UHT0_9ACTN|nr:hypothetical protein [Nocardiopsis ansamitocini]GLU46325.1 hypothetical protein Nans01_06760 [Nocardiopsis ansamitocini]